VSAPRELPPYEPALADAGLALVVRFGSREGGVPRPDSDLDLAVLHVEGRRLTHRELGEWRLRLSERYGLDADVVDLATADCLLRREVVTRGRVLHAQGRQAWVDFVARTLIDLDDLGPWLERCREGVRRVATRGAV
jgi:predicted nucleotidyltransferase